MAPPALARFRGALLRLRRAAGDPPLRAMAEAVHYSHAALCRVTSGDRVPTLAATLAYVAACGGEEVLWRRQYAQLMLGLETGAAVSFVPWIGYSQVDERTEAQVRTWETVSHSRVHQVRWQELWIEMRRYWRESGLTFAQISERTRTTEVAAQIGGRGIARSTLGDLCNPTVARIPTLRTIQGFLLALGKGPEVIAHWRRRYGQLETEMPHSPGRSPALDDLPGSTLVNRAAAMGLDLVEPSEAEVLALLRRNLWTALNDHGSPRTGAAAALPATR